MHNWKKSISVFCCIASALASSACAWRAGDAHFAVRDAAIADGALSVRLDWQPNEALLDGLDHGIPLVFDIDLSAQAPGLLGRERTVAAQRWRRELRYFPLTRQYQLREGNSARRGPVRSYSVRALVIAALADLRLPLDPALLAAPAQRYVLRIDLDRDALPGALRLPALFDANWHLSTGNHTWQARSGAG
ncbi:MAG: DUF4390 domain-containing protein [Proteobacteria bacterium]|nr:DUF4390 domain-containing protein [Pseudomonadota bacterium]